MENKVSVFKKSPIKVTISPIKTRFLSIKEYDANLTEIYQKTKQELKNGKNQQK